MVEHLFISQRLARLHGGGSEQTGSKKIARFIHQIFLGPCFYAILLKGFLREEHGFDA